jgi:hypothetical protein
MLGDMKSFISRPGGTYIEKCGAVSANAFHFTEGKMMITLAD